MESAYIVNGEETLHFLRVKLLAWSAGVFKELKEVLEKKKHEYLK